MLRARATNSEMRECDAHDSQPASSCRPCCPLTRKHLPQLLFQQICAVEGLVRGRDRRQRGALFAGEIGRIFCTAHIACRLPIPALVMVRTRTLSRAFIAQTTTWNGSQADHRLRSSFAHHRVDPFRAVGGHVVKVFAACCAPSASKNFSSVSLLCPRRPTPAGRSRGRRSRSSTGAPCGRRSRRSRSGQPREQVVRRPSVGDHPGHDVGDGAPRQPQKHRHHAQCGVRSQPRAGVFEHVAALGARPRPRHVRDHHAVLAARHPRRRGLQVRLCRPDVVGCATAASRHRRRSPAAGQDPRTPARRSRFGRTVNTSTSSVTGCLRRCLVSTSMSTSPTTMFWSPSPAANILDLRNAVHLFFVLNLDSVQNVSRTRRCAQNLSSANPRQRHKSPPSRELHRRRRGRPWLRDAAADRRAVAADV